jgi:hypothetical protein
MEYKDLTSKEKLFINSIEALITQHKLIEGEVIRAAAFILNNYKHFIKLKGGSK